MSIEDAFRCFLFLQCQVDDSDVISFLLSTEIIPLCLRTMEMGSELSKTVSAAILYILCIEIYVLVDMD